MATPRKPLGDLKNSILCSTAKLFDNDSTLKLSAGTPREALGDVKNGILGAGTPRKALGDVKNSLLGLTPKQIDTNQQAFKKRLIDFSKQNDEVVELTKNNTNLSETTSPIERCFCNQDHHVKEGYVLDVSDTEFESLETDTYKLDDWLTEYTLVDKDIKSWSQFLADNDLL